MNVSAESNPSENYFEYKPFSKPLTYVLLLPVIVPLSLTLLFAVPYTPILIAAAGLAFLFHRTTRPHGLIIWGSFAFLAVPLFVLGQTPHWEDWPYTRLMGSVAFMVLPWLPLSLPPAVPLFSYLWLVVLTPVVACEFAYWTARKRAWRMLAAGAFAAVLLSAYAIPAGNRTLANFERARGFMGRTLPAGELFQACGAPLCRIGNQGPLEARPHWIYTNGRQTIPVRIENGAATVFDRTYPFFDI